MIATVVLITIILILILKKERMTKTGDIETLLRQSARYAVAAQQDESPMIAVLHANYAAAYFYAAKDISTDQEIIQATGVNPIEFKKHITAIQDFTSKRTVNLCPEFGGDVDNYLAQIAGEA